MLDILFRMCGGLLYGLFRILGWPFVSLTGGAIGRVLYLAGGRRRSVTESEIQMLFGGERSVAEIRDIAKRSFDNYYKRHMETFFFGSLDRKRVDNLVEVRGLEHLDAALGQGKGVMLLLAHFGSFLLPLPFLGFRGYKVNQVTGRQQHGSLLAERFWLWRKREADRLPVSFIQVNKFLRPIFEAFGRNELVAIAFDGRDSTSWAETDFFGRNVKFSTGPFDLARRTGAVIIPTFMVRRPDNTHTLVLEQPFALAPGSDAKAAAAEDTRNFANLFAGYVRKYPCHFGMVLFKLRDEAPSPAEMRNS
jgi:KDO2-lipid IV(A) lauroyltransferase